MFEKVNPKHPDKIADIIAGALVDMAYAITPRPRIAAEVLLGHGYCYIINETSVALDPERVYEAVKRITGEDLEVSYLERPQDVILSSNQKGRLRCADNGIFRGVPLTGEQKSLTRLVKKIFKEFPFDGKCIRDNSKTVICQSNASDEELLKFCPSAIVNPLGFWTGGLDVDSGATNRKLGSDMADSITGGGLHGKDLTKADVSVNIYAFLKAQRERRKVEISCAIGDEFVDGRPYSEIVRIAKAYIKSIGGFEEFAKWGLVR